MKVPDVLPSFLYNLSHYQLTVNKIINQKLKGKFNAREQIPCQKRRHGIENPTLRYVGSPQYPGAHLRSRATVDCLRLPAGLSRISRFRDCHCPGPAPSPGSPPGINPTLSLHHRDQGIDGDANYLRRLDIHPVARAAHRHRFRVYQCPSVVYGRIASFQPRKLGSLQPGFELRRILQGIHTDGGIICQVASNRKTILQHAQLLKALNLLQLAEG